MAIGPFDKLGQYEPVPLDFNLLANLGAARQKRQDVNDEALAKLAGYFPDVIPGTADFSGAQDKMSGMKNEIADLAKQSVAGKISDRELKFKVAGMQQKLTTDPDIRLWEDRKAMRDKIYPDVVEKLSQQGKYHPALDKFNNPDLLRTYDSKQNSLMDLMPQAAPDYDAVYGGAWKMANENTSYVDSERNVRKGVDPRSIMPHAAELAKAHMTDPEADKIFRIERYNNPDIPNTPEAKFQVLTQKFAQAYKPAEGGTFENSAYGNSSGGGGKETLDPAEGVQSVIVGSPTINPSILGNVKNLADWQKETATMEAAAAKPGANQPAIQKRVEMRRNLETQFKSQALESAKQSLPKEEWEKVDALTGNGSPDAVKGLVDESFKDVIMAKNIKVGTSVLQPWLHADVSFKDALKTDNPKLYELLDDYYNKTPRVTVDPNLPYTGINTISADEVGKALKIYKEDVLNNPLNHIAMMTKLAPATKNAMQAYKDNLEQNFNEYFNKSQINVPTAHFLDKKGDVIPVEKFLGQSVNDRKFGELSNINDWTIMDPNYTGEQTTMEWLTRDHKRKSAGMKTLEELSKTDDKGNPVVPASYKGLTWLDIPGTMESGMDKRGYYIEMNVGTGDDSRTVLATYPQLTNQILKNTIPDYDADFVNKLAQEFPSEAATSGPISGILPNVKDLQLTKQGGQYTATYTDPLKGTPVTITANNYPELVKNLMPPNRYLKHIYKFIEWQNQGNAPSGE